MLDNSSSDDEEALLLLQLCEPPPRKRRPWIRCTNLEREEQGEFFRMCKELASNEDHYFWYFQMSKSSFEELNELLEPHICKADTNFRKAIGTRERLAICLRYIRTGESFAKIAASFKIGRSTVSKIIEVVSKAIWNVLQPLYMPYPTERSWRESEMGYQQLWNFPNCVGSIAGKHVKIIFPRANSIIKDKKHSSIVLLAIADPFYKFTLVDVGRYGDVGEKNIMENTDFYRHYLKGKCLLPHKPLPGTKEPVPHVLLGNKAFSMQPYLLRPFPKNTQDTRKNKFDDKFYHARSVIERTFELLTEKWRVFHLPMECNFEKAIYITRSACCLHNYVVIKHGAKIQDSSIKKPVPKLSKWAAKRMGLVDFTNINSRISCKTIHIREKFVSYFNDY